MWTILAQICWPCLEPLTRDSLASILARAADWVATPGDTPRNGGRERTGSALTDGSRFTVWFRMRLGIGWLRSPARKWNSESGESGESGVVTAFSATHRSVTRARSQR